MLACARRRGNYYSSTARLWSIRISSEIIKGSIIFLKRFCDIFGVSYFVLSSGSYKMGNFSCSMLGFNASGHKSYSFIMEHIRRRFKNFNLVLVLI